MERNTNTVVNRLQLGDRFYKVKDRTRTVYEMVPGKKKVTRYRTYGYFCKSDKDKAPIAIDGKTQVVFLRHNEDHELPEPPLKPLHKIRSNHPLNTAI